MEESQDGWDRLPEPKKLAHAKSQVTSGYLSIVEDDGGGSAGFEREKRRREKSRRRR